MTPRAKTRLKIWLVVLGVFILGGITGASLDSVYRLRASGSRPERHGRPSKEQRFERMKQDLSLTDTQAEQVRAILDQTRNEYRALREECRPKLDAVRQSARTRIRALLNPEQQQKFDAKVAEQDARRKADDQNKH